MGFHGFVRATGDLDVFVGVSEKNAEALVAAFHDFGLHLPEVRTREGRMRWVRWAAAKSGWVTGYVRYRRLPVAPRPPGARALVSPPA